MNTPITIFIYNRKVNIERLLLSLSQNKDFDKTDIYIFSDGGKDQKDWEKVYEIRNYIKLFYGLENIKLIERHSNYGLAKSIIEGVSMIFDKYDKIIVLEDDLIVSSDFIKYMNDTLRFFEYDDRVWSISGYSPSIKIPINYNKDIFLVPRASSWGWGTWKNRWVKCKWDSKVYSIWNDNVEQEKFNIGGNDLFKMLELQKLNKINSWAIRWDYSRFKCGMFTIYPVKSKVINDGFDGRGTHTSGNEKKYKGILSNDIVKLEYVEVNELVVKKFKEFRDLDWIGKVGYFSKKYGFYESIKKFKNILRK